MNKKIFLVGGMFVILLSVGFLLLDNDKQDINKDYSITDAYAGYVKLGISPSTYSRIPTEFDVNTRIKFKDGDKIYSLYESRTLKTNDIGKSFIVRIA